jgi:hypothetical protein
MPIKGRIEARDRASKIINERQKARAEKRAFRNKFSETASPMQKRRAAKMGSSVSADFMKKVAGPKNTTPTTPEGLKKVKQSYIGYNPFGGTDASTEKTVSSPVASVAKPKAKARAKAEAVKTVASKAAKLKVDVSNKLAPSTPKASSVEEYQKKGTMGKKKAPKLKVKASRRKQKGSKAATLKKGFGY